MPLETYKLIHFCGLMMLFFGLGGITMLKMANAPMTGPAKSLSFISHGLGLLLLLLGGFGMLAKMGFMGAMPSWAYGKLVIWLLFGGAAVLAKRKGQWGWPLLVFFVILGGAAAGLALYKP